MIRERVRRLKHSTSPSAPGAGGLGWLLACAQLGETALEAFVLARFVERIGAAALPLALALRAGMDALGSVLDERLLTNFSAALRIALATALGTALCVVSLLRPFDHWAIYLCFVAGSLVTRQRSIDFGVLTLEKLARGERAERLPGIYALGRIGALGSGGVLLLAGSSGLVMLLAACGFAVACGFATVMHFSQRFETPAPPSLTAGAGSHRMLIALMIGALALAAGRVALITQSGGLLSHAFDEHSLIRVLGGYNVATALVSLLIQIAILRRWLAAGRLEWVNGIWGLGYLLGQLGLALASSVSPVLMVPLALGARWVDGELRAALRGPVTNLLYEVMPPEDRRRARTWVIGVTVPVGGLVAGLLLSHLDSPQLLAWTGGIAGVCVGVSTLIQGRLWARSRVGLSIDHQQS